MPTRPAAITAVLAALVLGVVLLESLSGSRGTHPAPRPFEGLPTAAQGVVSSTLGARSPAYQVKPSAGGLRAENPAQGLSIRFAREGISVGSGGRELGLSLRAAGGGNALHTLAPVQPSAVANRVIYARAGLTEWYVNGPLGVEQGFAIAKPLGGDRAAPLTLAMKLTGNMRTTVTPDGRGLMLSRTGAGSLRYAGLLATDARGRTLHARLELRGADVLVRVDARRASYPVRIDPFVQQGEKLTGAGESGKGAFGYSVALSSDANTALIGGKDDNGHIGAAWVFTRAGGKWTQQGSKLTGGGESGEGRFGWSVALSSDGNTALISGPIDNAGKGAAWAFTRVGGKWTQQGSKLTGAGESGEGYFGIGVALSRDGTTALVGGWGDSGQVGAAWAFTLTEGAWAQQGPKLTGGGETGAGNFGKSTALSADGNTALIGGSFDNTAKGAAWVFARAEGNWTQQGSKLTGAGESGEGQLGWSAALSDDGNTALLGGPNDASHGAAWVFTRSEGAWAQQGSKLTGSDAMFGSSFGAGVALSADGNSALIGGNGDGNVGAAWGFARSGGVWTQPESKLTGAGESANGQFGFAVALSSDANTALVGGFGDNGEVGAAWAFLNLGPPMVTRVSPSKGAAGGATKVTITGGEFLGVTAVKFGTVNAKGFVVVSPTTITAESPAELAKTVDVTVTDPGGVSAISSLDRYTFGPPTVTNLSPNAGPKAGGTSLIVTGTGFGLGTEATGFKFGKVEATSVNCTSSTSCTVVAPPSATAGTVDVKATTASPRTSPKAAADQFTYS